MDSMNISQMGVLIQELSLELEKLRSNEIASRFIISFAQDLLDKLKTRWEREQSLSRTNV